MGRNGDRRKRRTKGLILHSKHPFQERNDPWTECRSGTGPSEPTYLLTCTESRRGNVHTPYTDDLSRGSTSDLGEDSSVPSDARRVRALTFSV